MQNIVRELKQAIEKDSLVVFCGSGTSSYLGLPNWKKLVITIINEISTDAPRYMPLVELLEKDVITPLMVLDLLEDEYKDIITGLLAKTLVFDKKLKCSLQEKILAISEKIITTNYDKAFENASDIPNVIFNDGKFKLAKISDNKSFIFKIHGDISNPEDCILFTRQYQKLYQDEAFLLGLKILFIQKTVLFIGFSLNDPFIVEIINAITRAYDSFNRRHYFITTDAMFNKEKFRGIVHPHLLNNYRELEDFLDDLLKYKKEAKSFAHVHNLKGGPDNLHIWNKEQFEKIIQCILNLRPVTVIRGLPGSGKTSLAREIAYLCLGKSKLNIVSLPRFDYIVWFSLNDCLTPDRVLNALFDEIGR
ncbi:MAG: hypothetical protein JWM28_1428 [Chitinophagaceae bacterium]|nr:hypothetical protein [Chitinophagaceae bacterium]